MVRFETTAHGNLEVAGMNPALRRGLLWGGAVTFLVAMAFAVLALTNESAMSWVESCVEGFLALGAAFLFAGIGGRNPLIFDAKKGEIRSGDSVIAHFANVRRILIADRQYQMNNGHINANHRFFITLEFQTGRRFSVIDDYDEFDVASLAAAISRITGRPVERAPN